MLHCSNSICEKIFVSFTFCKRIEKDCSLGGLLKNTLAGVEKVDEPCWQEVLEIRDAAGSAWK